MTGLSNKVQNKQPEHHCVIDTKVTTVQLKMKQIYFIFLCLLSYLTVSLCTCLSISWFQSKPGQHMLFLIHVPLRLELI